MAENTQIFKMLLKRVNVYCAMFVLINIVHSDIRQHRCLYALNILHYDLHFILHVLSRPNVLAAHVNSGQKQLPTWAIWNPQSHFAYEIFILQYD